MYVKNAEMYVTLQWELNMKMKKLPILWFNYYCDHNDILNKRFWFGSINLFFVCFINIMAGSNLVLRQTVFILTAMIIRGFNWFHMKYFDTLSSCAELQ